MLSHLNCDRLILFHHDCFQFSDGSKAPHSFDIVGRLERYGESEKLAYLERDPWDVMVSLYYQITGRFGDVFGYAGSLSEFIRDVGFSGAHSASISCAAVRASRDTTCLTLGGTWMTGTNRQADQAMFEDIYSLAMASTDFARDRRIVLRGTTTEVIDEIRGTRRHDSTK